jgi:hypothetical protein
VFHIVDFEFENGRGETSPGVTSLELGVEATAVTPERWSWSQRGGGRYHSAGLWREVGRSDAESAPDRRPLGLAQK